MPWVQDALAHRRVVGHACEQRSKVCEVLHWTARRYPIPIHRLGHPVKILC